MGTIKTKKEHERRIRTILNYPKSKPCSITGCATIHHAKGYCFAHYTHKSEATKVYQAFNRVKQKAEKRKIRFDLTQEQWSVLVKKDCYYCQGVLGKPVEKAGIGLDRINNKKSIGYTIKNVVPCCKVCNSIRGQYLSVEEALVAVQAVMKYRESKF